MHDSIVSLWHTDDLSYAEFSTAQHRRFAFEPHFHDTICLALIVRDAMRLTIGRWSETAHKGSVIVINAGEVHAGRGISAAGWTKRTVHATPADLAAQMEASGVPLRRGHGLKSGIYHDPELAHLFFDIHTSAQTNDDRLKRDEYLLRLARRLARIAAGPLTAEKPPDNRVEAEWAREYIEGHLFDPIRLDDLSKTALMPSYAISRAFKRRFGLPPHRYHAQRRIDVARKLIRDRVSLAEVSHLCSRTRPI